MAKSESTKIEFGYFHDYESEQFAFYRIPKVLFTDEYFRNLSSDAKVLYGLMLDRMALSIRHQWFDEEGKVYIIFTVEQVIQYMNCGRDKAMKTLAELDTKKGIGLIERVKQGFGKPDIIYVKNFILRTSKDVKNNDESEESMEDMKDETAQILSVKKEKKKVQPPKLYDLTTLQREANRLLGFTAQQTLDYTQSLYEKKLVTYPRTDSQYLTDDMEENALLVVGAVNSMFPEMSIKGSEPEIKRLLNSKKVSDHHAIIPTVEIANMDLKALPGGEKEILMLIASKLLCASKQEYIYKSIKTEISCHGELFTASGKNVLQYGWKEVEERFFKSYGKNAEKPEEEESDFPDIKIGQVFECVVVKFSEHFTAPPKHYTDVIFCERKEWIGIEERSSA